MPIFFSIIDCFLKRMKLILSNFSTNEFKNCFSIFDIILKQKGVFLTNEKTEGFFIDLGPEKISFVMG